MQNKYDGAMSQRGMGLKKKKQIKTATCDIINKIAIRLAEPFLFVS